MEQIIIEESINSIQFELIENHFILKKQLLTIKNKIKKLKIITLLFTFFVCFLSVTTLFLLDANPIKENIHTEALENTFILTIESTSLLVLFIIFLVYWSINNKLKKNLLNVLNHTSV